MLLMKRGSTKFESKIGWWRKILRNSMELETRDKNRASINIANQFGPKIRNNWLHQKCTQYIQNYTSNPSQLLGILKTIGEIHAKYVQNHH